jgi:hypothetical protein
VKWFLAIPHYFVLIFLGIGAFFAVIIAWFAVLFTGRYPRGIFDFVEGLFRGGARVQAAVLARSLSFRVPTARRLCLPVTGVRGPEPSIVLASFPLELDEKVGVADVRWIQLDVPVRRPCLSTSVGMLPKSMSSS